MENNLRKWHEDWEDRLPADIEHRVIQQVNTFSMFGKVVELFVPNALQTAAKMIGGDAGPTGDAGTQRNTLDIQDEWRRPPSDFRVG